jgi:hypothetical protein
VLCVPPLSSLLIPFNKLEDSSLEETPFNKKCLFFMEHPTKLCQAFLRNLEVVQAYLCRYYTFCRWAG